MVSAIYAAILGLLICKLALIVVKQRRHHQVRYESDGVEELVIARSAHSNACEYSPISLILLALLELNSGLLWLIHLFGLVIVLGRFVHAYGMIKARHRYRVRGMQLTIWSIIALAVFNLLYLPFSSLI